MPAKKKRKLPTPRKRVLKRAGPSRAQTATAPKKGMKMLKSTAAPSLHSAKAHGYVEFKLTPGTQGTAAAQAIRADVTANPTNLSVATVSHVERVDHNGNAAGGDTVLVYIECPSSNRANERRNLENWAHALEGRLHTQLASHVVFCCISDH